ncbi:MAG: GumC family protein [Mucilaginibacter sp.]
MSNNYNDTDLNDQKEYDLSLLETLLTYLRHWRWFIFSIVLFMFLAYGYIRLATPVFKIETDLLIKDNKNSLNGQNDLLKDLNLFTSDKVIDNEIQILKSNAIIAQVVKGLKLETSYYNTEGVRNHEIYDDIPFEVQLLKPSTDPGKAFHTKLTINLVDQNTANVNGKRVQVSTPYKTDAGIIIVKPRPNASNLRRVVIVKFNDIEDLLLHYSDNIKIEPSSKQSMVLIITMEDAIPLRGKDFLNRLVLEYNLAALQDKNKVTSNTLSFIEERLQVIAAELGTDEKNVEQYKTTNSITDISTQSQIFLQSVQDNDAALNKVQIQLSVLNSLNNYIKTDQTEASKLPSMLVGIEDPTLQGLVTKLGEAEIKREGFLQTVPETNPVITSIDDQIRSLKQAINASLQNLKKNLEITKQQLELKNNQFNGVIRQVPSKERGLLDVMRQQEIKNGLFTYLLQKREETAMQLASGVADSRIIDYAKSSKYPVKPVDKEVYLLFLLLAIVVPIAVIYLKKLLNYKVQQRQDIEQYTETPILAEVSHSSENEPLLVSSHPRSMVAEQVRALRTNLQFVIPEPDQKTILFTSSISGEGKSFVSLNLGASLAMAGKKVIILELDLRKPKLHSGLAIDNEIGLSNFLIGKADYAGVIKKISEQENYYIITSGPIPPNPAELLTNGRIKILLDYLKENFDYIVLDAPPVGLVTDAQILGAYADVTLFIVRHNYTAKNSIQKIDAFYRSGKFNHLNIVLNSIDLQIGYGYGYGYGYGGYYTDDKGKPSVIGRFFTRKNK